MGLLSKLDERALQLQQKAVPEGLQSVSSWRTSGGWFPFIHEPYTGAWQRNAEIAPVTTLLSFSAVYACITAIASDVAKLRIKLTKLSKDGVWEEVEKGSDVQEQSPYLPVLRRPNRYQNRIKFIEQWIVSKLLYGNAYILKQRKDRRGIVTGLYVLHPQCVKPLVAEDGGVYYEVDADNLSGIKERIIIPASEIIHDMMVSLWHPLIGVSPLYACSLSTTLGNTIQNNSTKFYANKSMPGGMLAAPGEISQETALRLKTYFESNFSGENVGKIFVAGDGVEFKPFGWNSQESQTIEQLRWTVEDVARAFRFPRYKLGDQMPPYANGPQSAQLLYYTDCVQFHAECIELCLDEGLELPADLWPEFDLDGLIRMDTKTLLETIEISARSGVAAPNENRKKLGYGPVTGGESPMVQQQNFSLAALAKRDASEDPFGTAKPPAPSPTPAPEPKPEPAPEKSAPQDPSPESVEWMLNGLLSKSPDSRYLH